MKQQTDILNEFRNEIDELIPKYKTFKRRIPISLQKNVSLVISKYLSELKDTEITKIVRKILFNPSEDHVETVLTSLKDSYKNKGLKQFISLRLEEIKILNEKDNIIPEIDKRYFCESCGKKDGKCHPESGYCYHCRTDNWKSREN